LTDRSLTIPPSWGSRAQVWQDGAWSPEKPKPEGYVYQRPAYLVGSDPKVHAGAPTQCGFCASALTPHTGGGVPKAYCDATCKNRATTRRRNEIQKAKNASRPPVVRDCEHCGVTFDRPPRKPQRFCTPACQVKAKNAKRSVKPLNWRPLTVEVVCARCGVTVQRPRAYRAKYCSPVCTQIAERARGDYRRRKEVAS
jgi:hypothetical protein